MPAEHKCSRLHGHSYRVTIHVTGPLDTELGWIQDFGDLKEAWKPLDAQLDHYYLNEVPGLENPTSEILAEWIWTRLKPSLPRLSTVTVRETCTAGCTFRGGR